MAKFDVVDRNGKKVSEIELSDAVFGITPNEKAVHIAVVNFLANQRQGTQNTKIRMEVSGGGKKPWRQKGTGHARQGSIRAPQWTHGGVALGPKPRSYNYHINNKVRRLALLSVLSDKAANGNMIVVDSLAVEAYKTKAVVAMLNAVGAGKKNLVVNESVDPMFVKSAANIQYTFKVATDATKVEIAQAVETLFPGAKVAKVNTISVRGRFRRQGLHGGYTAASKKAIVTLTKDSKEIEFFNSMV